MSRLPAIVSFLLPLAHVTMLSCVGMEAPVSPSTSPPVPATARETHDPFGAELSQLAEAGDADAQNRLGLLYNDGQRIPQDYVQAKQWFEKAAERGHAGAQVNLGTLYLLGHGASESDQMALFWFEQAADQQDALAFAKLGLMYERGRGVPLDFIQAHMWYNLSAAHGESRALVSRDTLANQMTSAQIAEAQKLAREWKPKPKQDR